MAVLNNQLSKKVEELEPKVKSLEWQLSLYKNALSALEKDQLVDGKEVSLVYSTLGVSKDQEWVAEELCARGIDDALIGIGKAGVVALDFVFEDNILVETCRAHERVMKAMPGLFLSDVQLGWVHKYKHCRSATIDEEAELNRALNSNELYYPNQEEQKILNDALRASSECIDKGEER